MSDHDTDSTDRGIDPEQVLADEPDQPADSGSAGYGLPTPRDEHSGELLPDDHSYEWNDQTVDIKLIPPTLEQLKSYQNFGTDPDMDELENVVDRHIVRPDIPAAKMTSREINCYVNGIIDYGSSGGSEQMEKVRQAIKEREGRDGGNSTQ